MLAECGNADEMPNLRHNQNHVMDDPIIVALLSVLCILVGFVFVKTCNAHEGGSNLEDSRGVPFVSGWPVVGSLPTKEFIDKHRSRLGETFSAHTLGQRIICTTNVLDHSTFYRAKKEIDMHKAVDYWMASVTGLPREMAERRVIMRRQACGDGERSGGVEATTCV